jgi:myo-inositol-1(or 4)-monophosphatase
MQAVLNIAIRSARKAAAYIIGERERLGVPADMDRLDKILENAEYLFVEGMRASHPEYAYFTRYQPAPEAEGETQCHIEVVDGLENLVRDIPHYALVMSIVTEGKPAHCMVYDVYTDQIFSASVGKGAQWNEFKCRVSSITKLDEAAISLGEVDKAPSVARTYQQGCASLGLAYVAAGRVDAFMGRNLSPAVLVAGCLLVKEGSGMVADLTGGLDYEKKGEVLAANVKLFKALVK